MTIEPSHYSGSAENAAFKELDWLSIAQFNSYEDAQKPVPFSGDNQVDTMLKGGGVNYLHGLIR